MSVRLYVGNLPGEVDRQALENLFTASGEVLSTKVIRDRKTNKCRGFAFLTVSTQELAEQFIEQFNGHAFGNTTLKLEIAQPRDKADGDDASSDDAPEPSVSDGSPVAEGTKATITKAATNKKRNRGGSRPQTTTTTSTTTSGTATQPDPRWASQLQRIKEQLQAAGQA